MTRELEGNSRCPPCGGRLKMGVATVPFVFLDTVVLIKKVPAEICHSCHEPYMVGKVTDRITDLLNQLRAFHAEVLIISYSEPQPIPVSTS
jgi:YgiT-type zinc finger domain-containing protein